MASSKPNKKIRTSTPGRALSAHTHFGLAHDPFTTLSLQERDLDIFLGREDLIDRLLSQALSVSNVGLAGEPGVGKSSLMQMLRAKVPHGYLTVAIGVPLDDPAYFLGELLREMLVSLKPVRGIDSKDIHRKLEAGELSKNAVLSVVRSIVSKLKKPLIVFVDDLEKIKGDRIHHLTRSEKTLQVLEELKTLLELPGIGFVMALQEEFYAKVNQVVREGAEPTLLGLFKNVVLVDKFDRSQLRGMLEARLRKAGWRRSPDDFLEPEALTLALSLSSGNPRRFMFLLSEAMYRGFKRSGKKVEFQDLFEAVNEHLKLDLVCKKLLYFLAKSGRAVASNPDLQAFMGLDMISISRRLEILTKNRLTEMVDVVDGAKVYALPGQKGPAQAPESPIQVSQTSQGEKVYHLPWKDN